MALMVGKIDVFDQACESWDAYSERLEQYFKANEVAENKKVPVLLSLIGSKTYGLLRDLISPTLPGDETYANLTAALKGHFNPKPLQIAERFRFHKRDQKEGESVQDFNVALRKLSEHCGFGAGLQDTLKDRFVCGLRNESIQKKLLSQDGLTYRQALEIAVAMETATRDAVELQQGHASSVHKVYTQPPKKLYSDRGKFERERSDHNNRPRKPCFRCTGTNHTAFECRFKDQTCFRCKGIGHIQKACMGTRTQERGRTQDTPRGKGSNVHVLEHDDDFEELVGCLEFHNLEGKTSSDAIWVTPNIDGQDIRMELDTGAAVSVVSETMFHQHFQTAPLEQTSMRLKTYSGESITPVGVKSVQVALNGQNAELELYVVRNGGPPLFGRDWLRVLNLDWKEIKSLHVSTVKTGSATGTVQMLKEKYEQVFRDELGTLKDIKARIKVPEDATPKFWKARPMPYAIKPKVDIELDRLVETGILQKVEHSEWATPIVPIPKKDGSVRICGDFKVTINPVLNVDTYPLPKIEDIFAALSGGQHFTKLDLRNAYLQMEVRPEDRKYLTINTHRGLFQYSRLVFGIASAPAIWQRTMDQILQGIEGVQCILDDMIITGETDEKHLGNLEAVLKRMDEYNLRLHGGKCEFFQDKVEFCGHVIDGQGLHKTQEKVEAVVDAPRPENVSQLRAFLGLVNYYGRFIPDLSARLKPLHSLLESGHEWSWTKECDSAFKDIKQAIASDQVLTHYDPGKPVKLASDASPYGLGAVLSHTDEDGTERPIAFASRSLNKAEKNYSQIDKEALSLVWAVKKFHAYLFGRRFTLVTDHQPLVSIFHPEKGIPVTTAARLQRYALYLAGFTYDIQYKNTTKHGNADGLSRIPIGQEKSKHEDILDATHIFFVSQVETLPVTCADIQRETRRDVTLSRVYDAVMRGWNDSSDKDLRPFYDKRAELSTHQQCLTWGIRIVIPSKLQPRVLEELHEGHVGVVKMKSLARSFIWWPGIDGNIESTCKACIGCQNVKHAPPGAPIHPWEWPSKPWQRIHIDFAGPFLDSMFLVIVDAHSKWPEVIPMKSTTAEKTVDVLRTVFARNGVPAQVVSDNGPQFTSEYFSSFMRSNGTKHITSAPYHPSTNGLAERFVQSFKSAMRASKNDAGSRSKKLANFLMKYRNTVRSTTNETPAQLFMGRNLPSRLDLIKPDIQRRVDEQRWKQSESRHTQCRVFEPGEDVTVRDYHGDAKWRYGKIAEKTGPVSYRVQIAPGVYWRRHVDQIRSSEVSAKQQLDVNPVTPSANQEVRLPVSGSNPVIVTSPNVVQEGGGAEISPDPVNEPAPDPPAVNKTVSPPQSRYPKRNTREPRIFEDYVRF